MKNWRFNKSSLVFALLTVDTLTANAITIAIRADWIPDTAHKSTPAYVWQNNPEVMKTYGVQSVTNFCVPASLGAAFLSQFAYEKPSATSLKVAGASSTSIDTAIFLNDLVKRCHADVKDGTTVDDGVKCAAEFYKDAGYAEAKVRVIRKYPYSLGASGIEHVNRLAELSDIQAALNNGYQVVASIASIQYDEAKKEWIKVGSHSINVTGVQAGSESQPTTLYIVNSNRAYRVDGVHPVFDEAILSKVDDKTAATIPEKYSPLSISGRLLNRPNSLTVLAGLTLLRTH